MPAQLAATSDISFWLDRADFYDDEWMTAVTTFDSFPELARMLDAPTVQSEAQREAFMVHKKTREEQGCTWPSFRNPSIMRS